MRVAGPPILGLQPRGGAVGRVDSPKVALMLEMPRGASTFLPRSGPISIYTHLHVDLGVHSDPLEARHGETRRATTNPVPSGAYRVLGIAGGF